jgi:hypothetical protein
MKFRHSLFVVAFVLFVSGPVAAAVLSIDKERAIAIHPVLKREKGPEDADADEGVRTRKRPPRFEA